VKLALQKSGIYLLMLLYGFTLFSFNNAERPNKEGFNILEETTVSSSSNSSTNQIYYCGFDRQLKLISESEESKKHKKIQEKQPYVTAVCVSVSPVLYKSRGIKSILEICHSQTDFNYTFHSFW